uniref:Uncharacterized protein n=1 Tax=Anguilla anguilla TaxID=7936 RepID=A0A0E9V7X8_ANGAN
MHSLSVLAGVGLQTLTASGLQDNALQIANKEENLVHSCLPPYHTATQVGNVQTCRGVITT